MRNKIEFRKEKHDTYPQYYKILLDGEDVGELWSWDDGKYAVNWTYIIPRFFIDNEHCDFLEDTKSWVKLEIESGLVDEKLEEVFGDVVHEW